MNGYRLVNWTASTIATLALAVGLLAAWTSDSHAAFKLHLSTQSGGLVEITDNGAGDLVGDVGAIGFAGSVGNFVLNFTIGTSKPVIGSVLEGEINLTSVNASNFAGDVLTMMVTDTGFENPGGGTALKPFITSVNSVHIAGSLSVETYFGSNNQEFELGTQVADIGPLGPGSGAGGETTWADVGSPFSMTMVVTVDHTNIAGLTSFDANFADPIPEPRTLALFGIGLLGLGFLSRRSRRTA